jgi:phosphoglycerol transferase MdoB-like AlkP superfamily enzyme
MVAGAVRAVGRGLWRWAWRSLGLALLVAAGLGLFRVVQVVMLWPGEGGPDVHQVLVACLQGLRFDLKVGAVMALLGAPLMVWRSPLPWKIWLGLGLMLSGLLALINLNYIDFYKSPIDDIVFGLVEDDTVAILRTIWADYPVLQLLLAVGLWTAAGLWLGRRWVGRMGQGPAVPHWSRMLGGLLVSLALLIAAKGTLQGMALDVQHWAVTSHPFANLMVPNGVVALENAWQRRSSAMNFRDAETGVRALGFASVAEAAGVLGLPGDAAVLRQALHPPIRASSGPKRDLVFLMVESWADEPLRYQRPGFDVMGQLKSVWPQAWVFSDVDAWQNGTHPTLEALMFGTPITPLAQGVLSRRRLPWSLPEVMHQAGYHTVFATSGSAGWHDLSRMLKVQGFDEIIDAGLLREKYPQGDAGIWGVWDEILFQHLRLRLEQGGPQGRPLFVFVLTTTNHSPYGLPPGWQAEGLDPLGWPGPDLQPELPASLLTYRYTNDQIGAFVAAQQARGERMPLIAATGDHNMRSLGSYASASRVALRHRVPLAIWGAPATGCQQDMRPASHRDIFPTLLPLLGIEQGFLKTGRSLLDCGRRSQEEPIGVAQSFTGALRTASGVWTAGQPESFICTDPKAGPACRFPTELDRQERARWALLDWNVRQFFVPH